MNYGENGEKKRCSHYYKHDVSVLFVFSVANYKSQHRRRRRITQFAASELASRFQFRTSRPRRGRIDS